MEISADRKEKLGKTINSVELRAWHSDHEDGDQKKQHLKQRNL
jgi:hypothetical protein